MSFLLEPKLPPRRLPLVGLFCLESALPTPQEDDRKEEADEEEEEEEDKKEMLGNQRIASNHGT